MTAPGPKPAIAEVGAASAASQQPASAGAALAAGPQDRRWRIRHHGGDRSAQGHRCGKEIEGARYLKSVGVDAINIPDSPRASARMSNQALCLMVAQQVGIETVLHYTCRDRNVLGMQSDLLGACAMGIRNLICITGDPPKMGNYPDATAVFDVDAIGLVNIVHNLNHGLDIGGNPIGNGHEVRDRRRRQSRRTQH